MKSGAHALFNATRHNTHTHMQVTTVEDVLCFYPILASSSPRDSQEQWAASDAAPGDQVQVLGPDLVRVRTDEHLLFLHVFFLLLGFYGGNPGNTGRTCKLHTERPGNKPRCGT